MKINPNKVKEIMLNFVSTKSWLETRNSAKDRICENCSIPHEDAPGNIAIAVVVGRINAHICENCGEYYISNGAGKVELETDYSEKEIEKIIKKILKLEETEDHDILFNKSLVDLTDLLIYYEEREHSDLYLFNRLDKSVQKCITYIAKIEDVEPELYYRDIQEYCWDWDTIVERESHRWWDSIIVQKKIEKKVFQWEWATANGDTDIFDLGWEFDINSFVEVEEETTITDTQIVNWLDKDLLHLIHTYFVKKRGTSIRDYVISQILEK